MSLGQVNGGYNLLGQGGAATAARMAPIPVPPPEPAVIVEPKLDVPWGDFRQSLGSSLRAALAWPVSAKDLLGADYFKDCWIDRRMPWRAVIAAALWHVVFFVSPFSLFNTTLPHNSAFDNAQLTWSGPIEDFPALEIAAARPKPKPVSRTEAPKPAQPVGADAYHPRQRIVTDPVHPNHPRQTLINPVAPKLAPRILPDLPNIVQVQAAAAPARPRAEISAAALARLHPVTHRRVTTAAAPMPDMLAPEPKAADITFATSANGPARPKLDLNANSAPRMTQRAQPGDSASAPQLSAAQTSPANGAPASLIALSAAPAPPKPDVQPPAGNLAARVSMSPEGKKPGVPPPAPSSAGGTSPVGISISGGNPKPNVIPGSRLNFKLPSRDLTARPEAGSQSDSAAERTTPPNFAILPPGAKPEQIFTDKRIYTLNVQMANLNSASGSWILHFSELGSGPANALPASTDLTGLAPIRKVDPKYPPDLIDQNIQGEVILYAVIRADGSVDSVQVVRSVDPQLDANAKSALSQWKFRPATKGGVPVALEAIVHVPFVLPDNR
ncbi:MAG: TonB family protein [Candidatus Acidiferrum sp.]